jgi:ribosomal protein S18 acetylase RimI-like enzyme
MEYKIRKITPNRYDDIINFWKRIEGLDLNEEDDSYENFKIYLKRNPKLNYMVIENGKIIATVKCGQDGRRGYLHKLAVDKNYRNRGIAKELIKIVLAELKRQGIKKCNVFVMDYNKFGLDFWKKINFKELVYDYRTLQTYL